VAEVPIHRNLGCWKGASSADFGSKREIQYGEDVIPESDKIEFNRPCIVCSSGDSGHVSFAASVTEDFILRICGAVVYVE
jgi:hypothetical protein